MSDLLNDLHDMADLLSAEEYSENAERIRDAIDEIERLRSVAAAALAPAAQVNPGREEIARVREAVSGALYKNQFQDDWRELVDPVVDAILAARPVAEGDAE